MGESNHLLNNMQLFNYRKIRMSNDVEILFIVKSKSYIFTCFCYDVRKKSWKEFEIEGIPAKNCVYNCVESLFPLTEN